jgi:hypothetical protein
MQEKKNEKENFGCLNNVATYSAFPTAMTRGE